MAKTKETEGELHNNYASLMISLFIEVRFDKIIIYLKVNYNLELIKIRKVNVLTFHFIKNYYNFENMIFFPNFSVSSGFKSVNILSKIKQCLSKV